MNKGSCLPPLIVFGGGCVTREVLTALDPPLGGGPVPPMSPLPATPVEPGHRHGEGREGGSGQACQGLRVSLAEKWAEAGVRGASVWCQCLRGLQELGCQGPTSILHTCKVYTSGELHLWR